VACLSQRERATVAISGCGGFRKYDFRLPSAMNFNQQVNKLNFMLHLHLRFCLREEESTHFCFNLVQFVGGWESKNFLTLTIYVINRAIYKRGILAFILSLQYLIVYNILKACFLS